MQTNQKSPDQSAINRTARSFLCCVPIIIAVLITTVTACAGKSEPETREALARQADRYAALIRDREALWLKNTVNGMQKLLLLEARRERGEPDRVSLALQMEDRMVRFGDGIRALSLELKYHGDSQFSPFLAVWAKDGGEFERAVKGAAVIPEAARAGLTMHEEEILFTDGGKDEIRVKVRLYCSNAELEQRLREIRD